MKNSNTLAVTRVGDTFIEKTGEVTETLTNLIEGNKIYKNVFLTLASATTSRCRYFALLKILVLLHQQVISKYKT